MTFDQSSFRLGGDNAPSAQLGQTKLQEESTEHTIAGSLIGIVRGVTPFSKGTAEGNDQIAHIAADTIASLPMVKTVAGGAIRATMLIDPTKSWDANAGSFGLNFVEGVALNRVSKLAMPESGFSKFMSSKLGTGLSAEVATHLTVGAGFGAIRSGFSADTYKDHQGNFSLSSTAENLIKGTATSALINVPAGMLGMRVARASSVALDKSAISPRLASVITGAGSGYAAGGVFGGVDAVMAGKNFTDVLKSINEGGIIGAASGGLMGSLDGSRLIGDHRAARSGATSERSGNVVEQTAAIETPNPAAKMRDAIEPRVTEKTETYYPANDDHFVFGAKTYESMSIKPTGVPRIEEVAHRLKAPEIRQEEYYTLDPNARGPWRDFDDFATNLVKGVQEFSVYKLKTDTADGGKPHEIEVVVPKKLDDQFAAVRQLRIKAEKPSVLDNLPAGQHLAVQKMVQDGDVNTFRAFFNGEETSQILPIVWARIKLNEHPLGNRALPEDFVTLIDELPTRGQIKRLFIWDQANPQDAWHAQDYNKPGFKAAATATESRGEIDFYLPNRSDKPNSAFRETLRGSLFHEHGHLTPPKDNLWTEASLLEKDGFYSTKYSERNNDERWAEDRSKAFMHPDVDKFLEFAQHAPLRAIVIAQELTTQMGSVSISQQSTFGKQLWARIKFTEEQVLPYAQAELNQHLRSGDVRTQEAAVRLLDRFGSKDQVEALVETAKTSKSDDVRRKAFDVAAKLSSTDPVEQFNFVWEQGLNNPRLSDLAVRRLRYFGLVDERASSYAGLLDVVTKNDLGGLARQVSRMNTDEGAALAYEYAMNMGRHIPGYQRKVALAALEDVPSLRLNALNTLSNQPPEGIAPVVRKFVNDGDADVAKAAREVLKGVELRTQMQDVGLLLDAGRDVSPRTIDVLGSSGERTTVPTLLQVLTRGSDATRGQVADHLAKFDPSVVKYYARLAKKTLPADQAKHLDLVTSGRRH